MELERGIGEVRAILRRHEDQATELAESAALRVAESGLLENSRDFAKINLFRVLSETHLSPRISGIAVIDAAGTPVAWKGKTFDLHPGPVVRASGILRSRIYRVLFAEVPVVGDAGATLGAVVVFSPFDVNYPLHNRYLRSGDFENEVSRRLGLRDIDIALKPDPLERARKDPTRVGGEVQNAAGETVGWLNIQIYPLEARLARIGHTRAGVRALLVAVILLVFAVLAARAALRRRATLFRAFALAALAFVARVGIFQAGFHELELLGTAFDPAWFSVSVEVFGLELGFLHSPGDVALTGLLLLFVTGVLLRVIATKGATLLPEGRRPGLGIAIAPAAVALAVSGILVWLEFLRALTFFSTVEYFSEQTVFPAVPTTLLLIGLFLSTLALFLAISFAALLPIRLIGGRSKLRLGAALLALFPIMLVVLLIASDLTQFLAVVVSAGFVGFTAVLAVWGRLGTGLRIATLTAIASVIVFPPFIREVWMEIRADVEEEAEVLFDPNQEKPLKHLLESDLAELARDERLVQRLAEDPGRVRSQLAFRLWAEGPLSRRPRGSKLSIIDRTGEMVISHFEIDMPPASWLPGPLRGMSAEEHTVWELDGIGEGKRQRFLVGSAPIYSNAGDFLGQVVVRMPVERPTLGSQPRPEILRSYEGETLGGEQRELHYSEYDGDLLEMTTNPFYPRVRRADPAAAAAILEEGRASFWLRERVAGMHWINLYRPRLEDGRVTGMMSVGFRSKETQGIFLSFFKMLLVNALTAFAAAVLYTLGSIRRFVLKFHHKLLISYLIVSAVPLILLAELNRSIAKSTAEEQMIQSQRRAVWLVRGELRDRAILERLGREVEPGTPLSRIHEIVSDEEVKEIGYRLGQEINVFLTEAGGGWGAPLVASSEPGIFDTELFSDRLPGNAFLETVLLGREFFSAKEKVGGYSFMVGYTPLVVAGKNGEDQVIGAISLPMIYGQDAVDRELARRNSVILALYLLILLVVVFIGMVLARRISSPIEGLVLATRRVSAGDLEYRIPGRPGDEFGYLVDSFNAMTEDLRESRERIVKAEKDAAWREMAKQVAHEIKNPLTPMRLSAQHILRAFKDDHGEFDDILTRGLNTIIRQSEALARIASEFSAFARLPTRQPSRVDLGAVAREVARLYTGAEKIRVVEEIEEVPDVLADHDEIRRVLVNLAANAIHAMEVSGGTLTIRSAVVVTRFEGEEKPLVVLTVSDTGVGIPPEDMEKLFMPNFSTKTGGTGLGLAISKAVVETFGGHIEVASEVGRGTTVTVRLPPAAPN